MSKRTTMEDVAREAGVSMMTVSRVVNAKGEISQETERRVQEVIDRLGYRPSRIARSLATKRTWTIGLVVPDNANPFFSDFARGAEHVAYQENYSVFLCNTEESLAREEIILQTLEDRQVDGVLVCSPRLDDDALLEKLNNHNAVVIFNREIKSDSYGIVMVDDTHGGKIAVKHLLASGHRAIGMLAGPENSSSGLKRLQAYLQTLEEHNFPPQSDWITHCLPTIEGGYSATKSLLSAHPQITALFCYNDLVAAGALRACRDLGLQIPDDCAIIGFDDIPLAELVSPTLTTCQVPRYELGSKAMQLLMKHIKQESNKHEVIKIEPTLIIRKSAP